MGTTSHIFQLYLCYVANYLLVTQSCHKNKFNRIKCICVIMFSTQMQYFSSKSIHIHIYIVLLLALSISMFTGKKEWGEKLLVNVYKVYSLLMTIQLFGHCRVIVCVFYLNLRIEIWELSDYYACFWIWDKASVNIELTYFNCFENWDLSSSSNDHADFNGVELLGYLKYWDLGFEIKPHHMQE